MSGANTPGPCLWNGNEIVQASTGRAVAGIAPNVPDEWGWLFAAAPELLAELRIVEWASMTPDRLSGGLWASCPTCGGIKPGIGSPKDRSGHREGCELAAVLAKAEGRAA